MSGLFDAYLEGKNLEQGFPHSFELQDWPEAALDPNILFNLPPGFPILPDDNLSSLLNHPPNLRGADSDDSLRVNPSEGRSILSSSSFSTPMSRSTTASTTPSTKADRPGPKTNAKPSSRFRPPTGERKQHRTGFHQVPSADGKVKRGRPSKDAYKAAGVNIDMYKHKGLILHGPINSIEEAIVKKSSSSFVPKTRKSKASIKKADSKRASQQTDTVQLSGPHQPLGSVSTTEQPWPSQVPSTNQTTFEGFPTYDTPQFVDSMFEQYHAPSQALFDATALENYNLEPQSDPFYQAESGTGCYSQPSFVGEAGPSNWNNNSNNNNNNLQYYSQAPAQAPLADPSQWMNQPVTYQTPVEAPVACTLQWTNRPVTYQAPTEKPLTEPLQWTNGPVTYQVPAEAPLTEPLQWTNRPITYQALGGMFGQDPIAPYAQSYNYQPPPPV